MIWGLTLLIIFELIADIFAKEYSLRGTYSFAIYALIAYVIANSFWLFALRDGVGLARGAIIFGVGQGVVAVALGILWYKETYSNTTMIGLVLGAISILFLLQAEPIK
jgi:hypothetical protein